MRYKIEDEKFFLDVAPPTAQWYRVDSGRVCGIFNHSLHTIYVALSFRDCGVKTLQLRPGDGQTYPFIIEKFYLKKGEAL